MPVGCCGCPGGMPICQLQGTSWAIAPADPGVGTGTGALWVQADPCTAQAGRDPCEPQAGIPAVLPGEAAAVPQAAPPACECGASSQAAGAGDETE